MNIEVRNPLRVAIFVTNVSGTYGGGRLAAFLLAHCLARVGAEVSFVTNAKPVFYEELKDFGHPGRVATYITKDFHLGLPEGGFDVVMVIPGQSQDRLFYIGARGFAKRRGARLALFNFETPNWFNSFSPTARSEDMWREWRRCIEDGCLVLSNSEQSMRFAQRYYVSHPATTFFDYWHQPINVQALARVQPQYREKRIVCFVRARDPHKGGQDLIDVLSEDLRGWTLSLIVGSTKLDEDYRAAIQSTAKRHGIGIEVRTLVSDTEKFLELKRARMLVYPSHFEGYGIPPVEALSAGTPCVCYDLPVFREVCGDALITAPIGDIEGLRAGIRQVLASSPEDWAHLPERVASVASVEACGTAAAKALQKYLRQDRVVEQPILAELRESRPNPQLVHIDSLRYDPVGLIEIRGWSPLVDERARVVASVNGIALGDVVRGLSRPDVLEQHPWVGTAECGFALCVPFQASVPKLELIVSALGLDGTIFDNEALTVEVNAAKQPFPKPDPARFQRGGLRHLREQGAGFILGWIATQAPILDLAVYADGHSLWLQRGRKRPDVMVKLEQFPEQDPGFAIHLDAEQLACVEGAKDLIYVATTTEGVFVERLKVKWEELPPGEAEYAPELPAGTAPDALPLVAEVRKVTYDEYGVVEFEGWVLSAPRVDVLKFWMAEEFLGEAIPDRLYMNIFEKRRVYGDAFCGFNFVGRAIGQPFEEAPYRVEFCYGDLVVHSVSGIATPQRRAAAAFASDASLLPPRLAAPEGRPIVILVVDDNQLLSATAGAPLRSLIAHLRRGGRDVIALLHGNPHLYSDDLERWRLLVDGVILVNPLTPEPGEAKPGPAWSTSSPALERSLGQLIAGQPRVAAVVVQNPALAPALSGVPAGGTQRLVLQGPKPTGWLSGIPVGTQLLGWGEDADIRLGIDIAGTAAQVPAVPDPAFAEGAAMLVLDGIGVPVAALGRAVAEAEGFAAMSRLRLAVLVDVPPLMPLPRIRQELGLPDHVVPVWLNGLSAALPEQVSVVVDLGGSTAGQVAAVALAKRMRLALWKEMAPAGLRRPWHAATLSDMLWSAIEAPPLDHAPYGALDELLTGTAPAEPARAAAE
ncbi:glycosyltransferase [Rhodovarius crocodyli]|uniref:Glycosyltransferase n=1 Tax=Rhodovarius crocodyli TaxID=1979269 RepID=A0A437LYT7_9PROT|nr:glycosyltransferase [Rhodovarius crocodyli]RVT90589.1 glycosyltransferase [Rhodovarius crocodyli]